MTQADIADFATWTEPQTAFQVQYSLPVFHEIDMTASDGYRRIPHGGIEVGGLLFGRRFAQGIRLEAFRSIECEHAQGPSFKLSERDVAGVREQMERAKADPELSGLETLGWFVAHTRGALELTEAERRLFDDLLPGAGRLTVLVKPEKFKPTLFSFVVRGADGSVRSEGPERAIILPLPGRPGGSAETSVRNSVFAAVPETPPAMAEPYVPPPLKEPAPEREPEQVFRALDFDPEPQHAPSPHTPPSPHTAATPEPEQVPVPPPFKWQFDRTPVEQSTLFGEYAHGGGRKVRREVEREGSRRGTAITAIVAAAILGGGAGYWFYQQMPTPIIQLTVEPQPTGLIVSWPPEQTSDASHAFVRINDGPLIELPPDAKAAGRWQVRADPDNVEVEIVAQHYFHDSRGIVRYIQAGR